MALSEIEELEMLRLRKQKALAASAAAAPPAPEPAPAPAPNPPERVGSLSQGFGYAVNNSPVVGGLENAISQATGLASTIGGGLAGLFATPFAGPERGAEIVRDVQQAGTYQPRTQAGVNISGLLAKIPEALGVVAHAVTTETPGQQTRGIIPVPRVDSPLTQMPLTDPTQEQHPNLRAAFETGVETAVENAPLIAGARLPGKAAAAAREATPVTQKIIEGVLPKPDPELLKTATLAADKFPDIQVPPDRLTPVGASGRAAAARETGDLLGAGGDAHEYANREALSRYAIREVDPEEASGRLKPETLDPAMDKAYALVNKGYDEIGPQKGTQIGKLLDPIREDAVQTGFGESPRVVEGYSRQLLEKADPATGEIPAEALRTWDQRVGKAARDSTDPDLARRLSDLQDVVREHVEKQVSPATAADMRTGRRRYAMGIELMPIARAKGTINSGIINDTGDLLRAVTDDRNGKTRVARGTQGGLIDLAKVGDLVSKPVDKSTGAAAVMHAAGKTVAPLTGVLPVAGRIYNKQGPAVTRMLVEKNRPPAEVPPAAAPVPMLGYDPNVSPSGGRVDLNPVAVTPEGQAIPPGLEAAREDLGVSQRNAGGTGEPPRATTYADYDLNTPEFQPPQTTAPAATAPSELAAVGQADFVPAPSRGARELPEPSFPQDILEPDTARVMTAGPPSEVAATEAAGRAMQTDEAALARKQQNAPPPPAPPAPPKPQPTAAEQARLDEIDKAMAAAKSPVVKETLGKTRSQVMKDVAAREASDKAKAAAAELRQAAAGITDAVTKKALLEHADKLDPPARTPEQQAAWEAAHPRGEGGTFVKKEAPK